MNDFIVYTNIEQRGWKPLKPIKTREKLEQTLRTILGAKENIQVIVVYSMSDRDIPLCSFNNKIQKEIDMESILRWCK